MVYMYVADVTVDDESFPVSGMISASNHRDAKEKAKKEVKEKHPKAIFIKIQEVKEWN